MVLLLYEFVGRTTRAVKRVLNKFPLRVRTYFVWIYELDRGSLEISENIHWSAISLISVWKKLYLEPKEQSTRRHPVIISFQKNTSTTHWRGTVLESK